MSEVDAADKSSGEPQSQMSTTEKFSEEVVSKDKSSGEVKSHTSSEEKSHTSSADKISDEEMSHANTVFGEEQEQVNATDKPDSQTGTANMSTEPESQTTTTDCSSDEPQSQVGMTNKSTAIEKSQMNTTDKYLGQLESSVSATDEPFGEKSQENVTDRGSGEPESKTSLDKSTGESKSQVCTTENFLREEKLLNAKDKSSGEPELQMGNTETFSEKETSQAASTDKSSVEPELRTSSTKKSSDEEKSQASTTDKSSDEPELRTSSANKSSDEEKSQARTTDKSFGEEKEQVNAKNEPDSQTGTTDMSGESSSQTATADYSPRESESQMGTINKSFANEKPQINTLCKYLGGLQSPDESFGEKSQHNVTDRGPGEPELQTETTDKSFGKPESQLDITDMSGALQSQRIATDMSWERSQENVSHRNSGESESQTSVDKSTGEPKSQVSTTYKYFGEEKPHVNARDESSSVPDVGITNKFSELQLRERTAEPFEEDKSWVQVANKASGASTADKSTGEPEPQRSNIGKCPTKDKSPKNITEKQEFEDGLRHRPFTHSGVGKLESQTGITDKSAKLELQTDIAIEEKRTTRYHWLIGGFIVLLLVGALKQFFNSWKGQPPIHHDSVLEIFFKEVASLKKDFPGQYEGLWFRSEKILQKHLNMSHPSAPSILILTAAQDGERTLRCVSKRLAKSYADSLRANWFMVYGPSKSKYDSATSKMEIDNELSLGFQSDSRAAVLYRLETLPAGSLLILYKYCDHENAAFKNVALVLTVLLEEHSLETDLSFTEVEEKVKDLLWERFANSEVSAHNEMDVDKLSGVWSRISHIVLPVLPVGSIESGSCPGIRD